MEPKLSLAELRKKYDQIKAGRENHWYDEGEYEYLVKAYFEDFVGDLLALAEANRPTIKVGANAYAKLYRDTIILKSGMVLELYPTRVELHGVSERWFFAMTRKGKEVLIAKVQESEIAAELPRIAMEDFLGDGPRTAVEEIAVKADAPITKTTEGTDTK